MLKNKFGVLFCALLFSISLNLSIVDAYAKGGGGGGGGRSSFSSSSSSRSFSSSSSKSVTTTSSKPSSSSTVSSSASASSGKSSFTAPKGASVWTGTTASTKPKTYGSSAFASVPAGVTVKKGFGGTSVFDKNAAVSMRQAAAVKSKQSLAADTKKFTKPPVASTVSYKSSPVFTTIKAPVGGYSRYKYDRGNYYQSRRYTAPAYAYRGSPSYGMYDGMFMWMMLDSVSDAAMMSMYFNHSDSAEFKQWRADAEELAKENKELKDKLTALDTKVSSMSGPKDPNYLPTGVPATVILASEALDAAQKDAIQTKIMSGSPSGIYSTYAGLLAHTSKDTFTFNEEKEASLDVKLEKFRRGEVDIILAPSDGIITSTAPYKQEFAKIVAKNAVLYKEATLLLTSNKNKVRKMSQFSEKTVIIPGANGSGTHKEWMKIVENDKSKKYAKVQVKNASFDNPEDTLKMLQANPDAVIMYVGGLNSKYIQTAESMAKKYDIRLVSMNDDMVGDIKNAAGDVALYEPAVIPEKKYPNLQSRKAFFGLIDVQDEINTYTVDATMLVHKAWVDKNGTEALDELVASIVSIQSMVEAKVNGLEEI